MQFPALPPPSEPPGSSYGAHQAATQNLFGSPGASAVGASLNPAQQQAATQGLLGLGAAPSAFNPHQQQIATQNLLGGSNPNAGVGPALNPVQQQAATLNLLGGTGPAAGVVDAFGTQQAVTANLLGAPPSMMAGTTPGVFGAQQAATQNLFGSSPNAGLGTTGLLDMTAGQLTPLGAAPGSSVYQQQQATQNLLSNDATSQQQQATQRLLGAGSAPVGTLTEQQQATARLLGIGTGGGAFASQALAPGGFSAQQEATNRLLGTSTPGVDAAQGQEAASRLLAAVERADNRIGNILGADGLRQRGPAIGDRGFTQYARRSAERAENEKPEVTRFGLVLNGEIQSAQLGSSGSGPLMCVFSVQHGADWTIVSGAPNGITQLATSSLPPATTFSSAVFRGGNPQEVVWNFPIGLAFKSTSPFGWPRIVITVYGTDLCNRRVIKGYGSVHVPCQPGRHTRTVRLYCPISSSPLKRLLGALFGNNAQLVDPRLVAGPDGREVVRVQSGGKVTASFDILLKDTEPFNYAF